MKRPVFESWMCAAILCITFSASAEDATEAEPPHLIADLTDGSRIVGTSVGEVIPILSEAYGKVNVRLVAGATLEFEDDRETVTVTFGNGDRITGIVDLATVGLETVFGKVSIPIRHVVRIQSVSSGALVTFTGKFKGRSGLVCGKEGADFDYFKISTPDGKVLFEDNFDEGQADRLGRSLWRFRDGWWLGYAHQPGHLPPHPFKFGDWKIEEGKLTFSQEGGGDYFVALVKDESFTTQVIETRLRCRAPTGYAGIAVWYQDVNNWLYVYIFPRMSQIWVLSNIDGWVYGLRVPSTVYPFEAAADIWYDLKVEADADAGTLTVHVDGNQVFTHIVNLGDEAE